MLVHGLSGGRPDGVGVLPNLMRDIEQRDNDGNGADDLPNIGQVVEIHPSEPLAVVGQALLLPNQKATSPSRTGIMGCPTIHLAFKLSFVFRAVVVAFRL